MRAIPFHEATHQLSRYAARHPLLTAEAFALTLILAAVASLYLVAAESAAAGPNELQAAAEAPGESEQKWVWQRRVDRGGHLYPVGL